MTDTINVTIRLDREVKEQAEKMFNNFGMNLSTAFNIFARQSIREGRIPFEIYDPLYNKKNQAELNRIKADIEVDKNPSAHELKSTIETSDYIEKLRGSLAAYPEMSVDKFLARKHADKELER